jgi:hypothetical protein
VTIAFHVAAGSCLAALCLPAIVLAQAAEETQELVPEVVTQDLDGDAEIETVVLFRDSEGRLVRAEADANGDGIADMWATYSVDDEGRATVELAVDVSSDGRPEEWRWSVAGIMTQVGRDTRGDGSPDVWSVLDSHGAVVEVRGDTDGDGLPDTWSTISLGGRTDRTAYDTSGDGQPDRWISYAEDGSITRIETDTDGDGEPDQVVSQ